MPVLSTAMQGARWGALVGLASGVLYSFGGLAVDLVTTGLNAGTAMAFGALIGMPVLGGLAGLGLGAMVGLGLAIVSQRHKRKPGRPEEDGPA